PVQVGQGPPSQFSPLLALHVGILLSSLSLKTHRTYPKAVSNKQILLLIALLLRKTCLNGVKKATIGSYCLNNLTFVSLL
ncbi:MAG: hypothetical protein ACRC9T_06440, partial [Vibrionaceae bacterium]